MHRKKHSFKKKSLPLKIKKSIILCQDTYSFTWKSLNVPFVKNDILKIFLTLNKFYEVFAQISRLYYCNVNFFGARTKDYFWFFTATVDKIGKHKALIKCQKQKQMNFDNIKYLDIPIKISEFLF